jgi:hypothetical protein
MTTEIRHGRYSDGLQQLSATSRTGSFSDGMASPPSRPGCFSDGLRGELGAGRRRGCFSDGQRLALARLTLPQVAIA